MLSTIRMQQRDEFITRSAITRDRRRVLPAELRNDVPIRHGNQLRMHCNLLILRPRYIAGTHLSPAWGWRSVSGLQKLGGTILVEPRKPHSLTTTAREFSSAEEFAPLASAHRHIAAARLPQSVRLGSLRLSAGGIYSLTSDHSLALFPPGPRRHPFQYQNHHSTNAGLQPFSRGQGTTQLADHGIRTTWAHCDRH